MEQQVSLHDVENLMNEKFGLLLYQVQKHNSQLKDDLRQELEGILWNIGLSRVA